MDHIFIRYVYLVLCRQLDSKIWWTRDCREMPHCQVVILSIGVLGGVFVGWMASKAHVLRVGSVGMLSSVALMAVFDYPRPLLPC